MHRNVRLVAITLAISIAVAITILFGASWRAAERDPLKANAGLGGGAPTKPEEFPRAALKYGRAPQRVKAFFVKVHPISTDRTYKELVAAVGHDDGYDAFALFTLTHICQRLVQTTLPRHAVIPAIDNFDPSWCEQVPENNQPQAWLREASDAGYLPALATYLKLLPSEQRLQNETSEQFSAYQQRLQSDMLAATDAGSVQAALFLSYGHANDTDAARVAEYEYSRLATDELNAISSQTGSTSDSSDATLVHFLGQAAQFSAMQKGSGLTPSQIANADASAGLMFSQLPCCVLVNMR